MGAALQSLSSSGSALCKRIMSLVRAVISRIIELEELICFDPDQKRRAQWWARISASSKPAAKCGWSKKWATKGLRQVRFTASENIIIFDPGLFDRPPGLVAPPSYGQSTHKREATWMRKALLAR